MNGDRGELDWTPEGHGAVARRGTGPVHEDGRGAQEGRGDTPRARGPRWIISIRALVVALAMIAAALGVLWLESAGVQGASAQLATEDAGKVMVPPLAGTVATATAPSATGPSAATPLPVIPSSGAQPIADLPPTAAGSKAGGGMVPEGSLVVHVAGAVKNPGVFTLVAGSRVFQAVEAAGGALPTAGLAALNLAAPLTDGIQILVPTKDEAANIAAHPGIVQQPEGQAAAPGTGGTDSPTLINLNSASASEFETLPGVGPVLAGRIVEWRTDHGPFSSVEGLSAVTGIGPKLLAGLQDLVTVS